VKPKNRLISSAASGAAKASGAAFALALLALAGCPEKDMSQSYLQKTGDGARQSSFFNPSPEDMIEDKETGLTVIKGVLNINFSPKISREEAEKTIKAAGGQVVGYDYSVNFFQAKFPLDQEALDKKRLELLGKPGIEMASIAAVSVHKDPYYVK